MDLASFNDYVELFGQPSDPDAVQAMLTLVNQAVSDRIIPEILADWNASGQVPAEVRLFVLKTTRTLALAPQPGLRSESLGGYSVGYSDVEGIDQLLDTDLLAPYTGMGRAYSITTPSAYRVRERGFRPEMPTTPRAVFEDWPVSYEETSQPVRRG